MNDVPAVVVVVVAVSETGMLTRLTSDLCIVCLLNM